MYYDKEFETIKLDDIIGLLNNKPVQKINTHNNRQDDHELYYDTKSKKTNNSINKNKIPSIHDKPDRFRFSGQLNPINRQKHNINTAIQEVKQQQNNQRLRNQNIIHAEKNKNFMIKKHSGIPNTSNFKSNYQQQQMNQQLQIIRNMYTNEIIIRNTRQILVPNSKTPRILIFRAYKVKHIDQFKESEKNEQFKQDVNDQIKYGMVQQIDQKQQVVNDRQQTKQNMNQADKKNQKQQRVETEKDDESIQEQILDSNNQSINESVAQCQITDKESIQNNQQEQKVGKQIEIQKVEQEQNEKLEQEQNEKTEQEKNEKQLQIKTQNLVNLNNLYMNNPYYFRMVNCNVFVIKKTLEDNGFQEVPKNVNNVNQSHINIIWYNCSVKQDVFNQLLPYQKINHFPKSLEICRKDLMHFNLDKMKSKFQIQYSFYPKTYIIPNDVQQVREEFEKQQNSNYGGSNLWIVKPAGSSQGKGIFLTDNFQELISKQQSQKMIVSEYISNPLLINSLKFDLRIYVIITGVNPLKVYRYKEGLARFATKNYSLQDMKSKYTHLTNYAINKNNPDFQWNEDSAQDNVGSKQSFTALLSQLEKQGVDVYYLQSQIDDIIIKTILSGENHIFSGFNNYVPFMNNCFEILGFDILIDSTYKPWLLEVNLCPSLATDSPLDLKIKSSLLADTFTIIGILPYDQRVGHCYSSDHFINKKVEKNSKTVNFLNSLSKQDRQVIYLAEEELARKRNCF